MIVLTTVLSFRNRCMIAAGCLAFLFSLQSASASLDFQLQDVPDIVVFAIRLEYDSDTDMLTANGTPFQYDDDGIVENILGGTFNLTAEINNEVFTSGSFEMRGRIPTLGINDDTLLLAGTLTDGGTPEGPSSQLNFTFDPTGGELLADYSVGTGIGGIKFSGVPNDFSANFTTSTGNADVGVLVPELSSAAIWFLLLAPALLLIRRRANCAACNP